MRFLIALILIIIYIFILLFTTKVSVGTKVLTENFIGAVVATVLIASLFCIPKPKRNNKHFFKMFNIILFILIIGKYGKVIEVINKNALPPKEIISSNNKIKLIIPNSWVREEPEDENIVLKIRNESGFLNVIVGYEYVGNTEIELADYAKIIRDHFKSNAPGFESISSMERCESSKLPCLFQIAKTSIGKSSTTTILASLKGRNNYYNFMAITDPELFKTYKEDFFKALNSLDETKN